jgi:hypothetical protein
MKDLRNLKTNAAGRVVPIHPISLSWDCWIECRTFWTRKKSGFFRSGKPTGQLVVLKTY